MKDNFELEIDPSGKITTIYQPGIEKFAEELGGEVIHSARASNVEWEVVDKFDCTRVAGWTVRAAHDPILRIVEHNEISMAGTKAGYRVSRALSVNTAVFSTREEALKWEEKFFWQLLERKQ